MGKRKAFISYNSHQAIPILMKLRVAIPILVGFPRDPWGPCKWDVRAHLQETIHCRVQLWSMLTVDRCWQPTVSLYRQPSRGSVW